MLSTLTEKVDKTVTHFSQKQQQLKKQKKKKKNVSKIMRRCRRIRMCEMMLMTEGMRCEGHTHSPPPCPATSINIIIFPPCPNYSSFSPLPTVSINSSLSPRLVMFCLCNMIY